MQPDQQYAEIDEGTWWLMGLVALFFDGVGAGVNLIPIAGQILDMMNDLIADFTFWLWFKMKGAKYSKVTMFGAFIVKFIPIVNILPEYSGMIVIMYMQSRAAKRLKK